MVVVAGVETSLPTLVGIPMAWPVSPAKGNIGDVAASRDMVRTGGVGREIDDVEA